MARLVELAKTIRSKNAGPYHITFDIIFPDSATYERVKSSGALSRESVARLFSIEPERISYFGAFDPACAFKFTVKRLKPSGGPGERDVFGCQQYPPLFDIVVPDE